MKAAAVSDTPTLLNRVHEQVRDRLGADYDRLRLARATLGIFFTGTRLDNGVGGLSATPIKSVPQAVCCPGSASAIPKSGRLAGRRVGDILRDLQRPGDLRKALAIATLNALVETLWQRDGPPTDSETLSGDAWDALTIAPEQRVVLVGAFAPYIRDLRRRGQPFHVLELDPAALKADEMPYYVPPHRVSEVLPGADLMIATATTLINDSLGGLLALLRPGAQVALIGPTAPLLPAAFVGSGVTLLGGTRVRQPDAVLDLLAEGGSGYHMFGAHVERITLCLSRAA